MMGRPNFIHRFVPAQDRRRSPLLLLHRTGGNEDDFIEAGQRVAPGAALLAPRGNVIEDGKPRFFRRLARGQFDIDDLKIRTQELAAFVTWARAAYDLEAPVAFGFSNGANIAWPLMLSHPVVLKAAILMRPMLAFDPRPIGDLKGLPVLVIAGREDATVAPTRAHEVPELLREAGAKVTFQWVQADHNVSIDDAKIAANWINNLGL